MSEKSSRPPVGNHAHDDLDARLDRVASLGEPVPRALYRFVAAQPSPVSRVQAAAEFGVAPHVAKYNLDRLVDAGLLEAEYRRPPGRGGPGAGRPTKLYRRAAGDVAVSLPERRYDLAGRLLARAVARAEASRMAVGDAVREVAREAGRSLGSDALDRRTPRDQVANTEAILGVLAAGGFEPTCEQGDIIVKNCPFRALAEEETDLVCGMNLELLRGILDGVGATELIAELDPAPERCCVTIRHR